MQVKADIAGLANSLQKPLRPLWISQNSRIWIDQVPDPEDLPFTPIILLSASLPNARQRRFARERPNCPLEQYLGAICTCSDWQVQHCTLPDSKHEEGQVQEGMPACLQLAQSSTLSS